jgi:hypothetical protein
MVGAESLVSSAQDLLPTRIPAVQDAEEAMKRLVGEWA